MQNPTPIPGNRHKHHGQTLARSGPWGSQRGGHIRLQAAPRAGLQPTCPPCCRPPRRRRPVCPALTWHGAWHGVGQQPGSAKAPRSGRVVPCGDIEPVPFRLPIQVAPPKRAASPAQLAPSAPAGASAFPRVPVQLAPNAPWTLQPVAPQLSPALRYLPGATGGIPGPQASGWPSVPGGGLNTLSPRPRFFPTGPAPPHRQPEGGIPPRPS